MTEFLPYATRRVLLPVALVAVLLAPAAGRETWVVGTGGRSWEASAAEMANLEDDGGTLQPIDVSGHNLALESVSRGGQVQGTHFADEPLLFGVNGRALQGWGIRQPILQRVIWERQYIRGRDKQGNARTTDRFQDVTIIVDLGARFGIDSLSIHGFPGRPERLVRAFQVYAHPGVEPITLPERTEFGVWVSWFPFIRDWPLLVRVDEVVSDDGVVGEAFPLTNARYVGFNDRNSLPDPEGWEIDEFQVWGSGYVLSAAYTSTIIDLGGLVNLGKIGWRAEVPAGTQIKVRTRTGRTAEPYLYHERTGLGLTGQNQVTRARFESLRESQRGDVVIDSEHWDEWSSEYPASGTRVEALGPRRALEIAVSFDSQSSLERAVLDTLGLEFSSRLLAGSLTGEIDPPIVVPGEVTALRYWLKAAVEPGQAGFDGLRMNTPAQIVPGSVRNLTIDGEAVTFEAPVDSAGCSLWFEDDPVTSAGPDTVLLAFEFDARVFLHGTPFAVRVTDSRSGEIPQDVLPGDANPDAGIDQTQVTWSLSGDLVTDFQINRVFTPNGDGINDVLGVSYALLQLTDAARVRFEIFDLGGRRVYLADEHQAAGYHVLKWDPVGGERVPPGIYVYRLEVAGDGRSDGVTGTLAVAY